MNYVIIHKRRLIKLMASLVIGLGMIGCTSGKQARLILSVDPLDVSLFSKSGQRSSSLLSSDPFRHSLLSAPWAPSSVTGFDCMFANIMGEQIGEWTANKDTVQNNLGCGYLGAYSEMITVVQGGTVTVDVAVGSNRIVQVIGVRSTIGCSTALTSTSVSSLSSYPGMFEMGRVVTDTFQDQLIDVSNAYSTASARDFRCFLGTPPQGVDVTPPTIGGVISQASSGGGVTLSWAAATDNVTASSSLQYKIVRALTATSINTVAGADAGTLVVDWTTNMTSSLVTLSGGSTYAFTVLVRDAAGNEAVYVPVTVASDTTPPVVGGGLSGYAPNTSSIQLSWNAATDNVTIASALQYKVVTSSSTSTINTVSGADAATIVTDWTANLTSTTATGLTSGATYAYAVLVQDSAGNKSLYTPISVSVVVDTTPPTAGGGLAASPAQTSVTLTWTNSTDNITPIGSLQYKVVRSSLVTNINTVSGAEAGTLVMDWTTNKISTNASGLSAGTTYAFTVLVKDASGNKSVYTPISATTNAAGPSNPVVVAYKPTGESSVKVISNSGVNSGFFFNNAYYALVQGTYEYLLKMDLNGVIDTTFGTNGWQKVIAMSGAPIGMTNGTTWKVCNGGVYFYWSSSGVFNLLRLNLSVNPPTITNLNLSTNVTAGGVLNDMNCLGTKLVTTFIINGGPNAVGVATYDTTGGTYVSNVSLSQGTYSDIGTPFLDGSNNLWIYSYLHKFLQFDQSNLTVTSSQNFASSTVYFDGEQFTSSSDFMLYNRSGANVKFWADTVANIMSNFVSGSGTPTFTTTFSSVVSGGNISDVRFCKADNYYLGYEDSYQTYPNYTFAAKLFKRSGSSTVPSSLFNNGNELLLTNSSLYNFYTGRYYLSIACDDASHRAAFSYTNAAGNLVINLIDTTPPSLSSMALAVTSLGTNSISFSWTKATDAVSAQSALTYKVYQSGPNPAYNSFSTVEQVEAGTLISSSLDTNTSTINAGITAGNSYYFNVIVQNEAGVKTVYKPLGEFFKANLVLDYPFNGNSNDVSSTANNGVLNAGPTLTADRFGNANSAYAFVMASHQFINSNANIGITGASPRSISYWMKASSATVPATMISVSYGTDTTLGSFGNILQPTSNLIQMWTYGANDFSSAQTATTDWEHWVITYDGTVYSGYKNGTLTTSSTLTLNTGDNRLSVGNGPLGSTTDNSRWFDGSIDDVRVYSNALSAGEVSILYDATRP